MKPYGTDANGTKPQVGDFVAYNYSGSIATGYITKIGKRNSRYTSLGGRPIYYITQIAPTDGHESVVRGGSDCVLVLEQGDGVVKGFYEPK